MYKYNQSPRQKKREILSKTNRTYNHSKPCHFKSQKTIQFHRLSLSPCIYFYCISFHTYYTLLTFTNWVLEGFMFQQGTYVKWHCLFLFIFFLKENSSNKELRRNPAAPMAIGVIWINDVGTWRQICKQVT